MRKINFSIDPFSLPTELTAYVLDRNDACHPYLEQYKEIRDFHYVHKHGWEVKGEDDYDEFSDFVVLVRGEKVMVGCRVIKDNHRHGLPIRKLLQKVGKPTSQVPKGAFEASRFGINPKLLGTREVNQYLEIFASVMADYCAECGAKEVFAVLISILERRFSKIDFLDVERLPDGTRASHGESVFNTVKIGHNRPIIDQPQLMRLAS